jgi:acetyl/propionyl-CoA carboxylase alpha subunit/acetyl-CoA carboxylase carboxyltransferase component
MLKRVLIANRGEIAVRIARAAHDLGIEPIAVYAIDDHTSGHVTAASRAVRLVGSGSRAYLDQAALITIARDHECDAIHPGYGFLSENAAFAAAVNEAGLVFIGPSPETLQTLGDKLAARDLARRSGVRCPAGPAGHVTARDVADLLEASRDGSVMIKAVAGGGGRGMRIVRRGDDVSALMASAAREAEAAFGNSAIYAEELVRAARHIEIQIVGDGHEVIALGERDCTLQRRHQKLVELAPAPNLHAAVRRRMIDAAIAMASALSYRGLGTFEFLVDADSAASPDARALFIEANPRVQVEHTVTEQAYGIDLVQSGLAIASGARLADLGLIEASRRGPIRAALQLRINAETIAHDGAVTASAGTITSLVLPSGPGVRVDTHLTPGITISPLYDSLVAKLIVDAPLGDLSRLMTKAQRTLAETDIQGIATNGPFLSALLATDAVQRNEVTTRYIDDHGAEIAARAPLPVARAAAGAQPQPQAQAWATTEHTITAPLPGSVIAIEAQEGMRAARGATLAILESMKMEHLIEAPRSGVVRVVHIARGDVVMPGQPLFDIEPDNSADDNAATIATIDLDHIRPDLAEAIAAHRFTRDENRASAVAKRRKTGMRTARENVDDLVDAGSFIEYGALAVSAQRARRTFEDLQQNTPADGLITGIGTVNAASMPADKARVAVMAYDYMVLAGTQGKLNHRKSDRLLDVASQWQIPLVLFAEGGGGRPGDTDHTAVAGLDCTTFHHFAALSGRVPIIGIVAGRCFAGNAALLGCSDVIISTTNASIGMGGPAMIEGGGLGVVAPDDVGPVSVNGPNGVIDVLVDDEAEAVATAKRYLAYAHRIDGTPTGKDQRALRYVIPENRLRVYDIRAVIDTLADDGSVLELRRAFGIGVVTAFVRINGKPFGLIANNSKHLGGAIDAPACDKLARFLQLCDSYGLPIVSLCDTPGFMVGPESEKSAMVRKTSRLFIAGASLRVPMFTIVLRKGYGLGAMAMAAGMFHAPLFNASWPSGEFGGMGLEGAVRLGYRKELDATGSPEAREALFKDLVAKSYARGKALNMGAFLEIDAVIDPADTRAWILRGLASIPATLSPRRPVIDAW